MASWKIFNQPPTHKSMNLVGQAKILMVSTQWVGLVDKFNKLNEIISIILDNILLHQIIKEKKKLQFLLKMITKKKNILESEIRLAHKLRIITKSYS